MKIRVKFFAYFRELFQGNEHEIELEKGASIEELLNLLSDSPERRVEIFKGSELKPALVVMKNGIHINSLNGLHTELEEGDTIAVFPFLGGG